jgi:hypothetical protein
MLNVNLQEITDLNTDRYHEKLQADSRVFTVEEQLEAGFP